MNRWRSVARRWGAALLLLVLFWTASQIASRVPQVVALGTSVHTLGLGDYSADSLTSLAPLSMQVLDEVRADAGTPSAGTPSASTTPAAPPPTAPPAPRPTPPRTPPPTATPRPGPAVINGTVVANLTGLPISGATVSLSPGGLTTTTNGNGAFTFANVTPGTYTLSVSATLYTTSTQTVTVAPGQTLTLSIRLRTLLGL